MLTLSIIAMPCKATHSYTTHTHTQHTNYITPLICVTPVQCAYTRNVAMSHCRMYRFAISFCGWKNHYHIIANCYICSHIARIKFHTLFCIAVCCHLHEQWRAQMHRCMITRVKYTKMITRNLFIVDVVLGAYMRKKENYTQTHRV